VTAILKGRAVTLIVAVCALSGCNKSPYELAPVHGTITINGRPVTQGRVMFAPIASGEHRDVGKPAFGTLQPDGSFVLTTFVDGDGAVVGEHWVTIFGPDKDTAAVVPVSGSVSGPKFGRLSVPQKMSVTAAQDNQIDLHLRSQDVARYGVL
jgi:hypothetical protein